MKRFRPLEGSRVLPGADGAITPQPPGLRLAGHVRVRALRRGQLLQGHFGGVFLGVVDVLPVVPVARGDVLAFDRYRAGPGCTAA